MAGHVVVEIYIQHKYIPLYIYALIFVCVTCSIVELQYGITLPVGSALPGASKQAKAQAAEW